MRVIVTRPRRDAERWALELSALALEAVALPLIQLGPVADPAELVQAWQHLADYVGVMFVSANAAEQFFAVRPRTVLALKAQAGAKPRAWATGPGTTKALLHAGVAAQLIDAPASDAGQFDSETLWQVVAAQVRPGDRVLIVRGAQQLGQSGQEPVKTRGSGRDWLAHQLDQAGARVDFVVAYQRRAPVLSPADFELVRQAASDGSVWLFSSSEAIANLRTALPGQNWEAAIALATHPRIAMAARNIGFGVVLQSRPTLGDVVVVLKRLTQ